MHNKRRNYFIDKNFQVEFILKFCSLVIFGSIIFGMILYIFSSRTLTTSFENSRLVVKSTADYLLPTLVYGGIIVAIVTAVAATIVVLLMTHRIAGPMYRFEKYINEISGGELVSDLMIRKNDQFQRIVGAFNKMSHSLKEVITEIDRISNKLGSLIEKLSNSSGKEPFSKEDIKGIVSELKKDNEDMLKAVRYFKIKA